MAGSLKDCQFNFDSHITKITHGSGWTTNTSGSTFSGTGLDMSGTYTVELENGYVIDTVTITNGTLDSKTDNSFAITVNSYDATTIVNITSKQQTSTTKLIKIKFKDNLTFTSDQIFDITFKSNNQNFTQFLGQYGKGFTLSYNSTSVYDFINGWATPYNIIEIDPTQTNFNAFITAMKSNIEGVELESGTYVWVDVPTPFKFNLSTAINFVSNNIELARITIDMDSYDIVYTSSNKEKYIAYSVNNDGWFNNAYKTIATSENQYIDYDFYNFAILGNKLVKQGSTPTYSFKHWKKSNVVVNRTLVGEKYYYFKPYTILGLYRIDTTLTNCTGASVNATKIQENGGLTLTFTANSGYELPTGVSVTNVTSYNWNKSTGVLAISKPTGDVAIEIVAVSALPQLSTPSNVAVTDTTLIFDEVANATSYEVFVDNVSIGTHTMPSVISLKWKFNGTKAFIPQRSYDNSFEIDYDVYNNDTLVESNLHYVYFNDNYTYMAFGSSGYWDTTNNKYGGGNIILFKTEPSGFLLQFLQEHCEALN